MNRVSLVTKVKTAQKDGDRITRWLNQEYYSEYERKNARNTSASRARVATILTDLQDAESRLRLFSEEHPEHDHFDFPPEEIASLLGRINEAFSDYPRFASVEIAYGERGDAILRAETGTVGRRPSGETGAVYEIERLLNAGLLVRVQQCLCGRWFFATRSDQKSCSAKCRHKLYEQTPEAQEKRRAYLKQYQALKRTGKVK